MKARNLVPPNVRVRASPCANRDDKVLLPTTRSVQRRSVTGRGEEGRQGQPLGYWCVRLGGVGGTKKQRNKGRPMEDSDRGGAGWNRDRSRARRSVLSHSEPLTRMASRECHPDASGAPQFSASGPGVWRGVGTLLLERFQCSPSHLVAQDWQSPVAMGLRVRVS